MDSLAPPRLGFVPASAIRIRLVADLLAAWRRTNPILPFTRSSVLRLVFCLGARDQRPAEVRARFIFPVILGRLLAPGAALGGLEPRGRTFSWVCVIWRAMRKQVNQGTCF
jgi:hypothetical protein